MAEAWEASEDGAEVARLTAPPSGGGEKGWKLTLDPSTATSGLSTFVLKVQPQTLKCVPREALSFILKQASSFHITIPVEVFIHGHL